MTNSTAGRMPVDLDQFQDRLDHPDRYAPPEKRAERQYTPTQLIAHGITKMTWREVENMAKAIQDKSKDNVPLAAAIVAWAEGWEELQ